MGWPKLFQCAYNSSGNAKISATQYLTFVLRALGYDSSKDFQWDKAWELTDKLGITKGQYSASSKFERSNVVLVSRAALEANMAGTSKTLLNQLKEDGVVAADASLNLKTVKLRDFWSDENEENIKSVAAKKVGSNYRYDVSFSSNTFTRIKFYPSGLNSSYNFDDLSFPIKNPSSSHLSFTVPSEYIFNNPVNNRLATIQFLNDNTKRSVLFVIRTTLLYADDTNWKDSDIPATATEVEGAWSPNNSKPSEVKTIKVEKAGDYYVFYVSLAPSSVSRIHLMAAGIGSSSAKDLNVHEYSYIGISRSTGNISFRIPADYILDNPIYRATDDPFKGILIQFFQDGNTLGSFSFRASSLQE